ncbi:MAG: hypothetical protein QOI82_1461 [Actinomycetota bacterium]|nr:hypothetical protein [Actinomycetota bacterium]
MPAALIGEFSDSAPVGVTQAAAARDRRVWVAKRGADKVFQTRAANVGFDARNHDIYMGTEYNLDLLWQRAEGDHRHVQGLAQGIALTGEVPAKGFSNVLVPYVAHLLARHPTLGLVDEGFSDLRKPDPLGIGARMRHTALETRRHLFFQLCDALLTARRWLLLSCPDGVELVGTDVGWQWMPGAMPGEVFLPLNPRLALVIRGDGASYFRDAEMIPIPVVTWSAEDIEIRRDVMMRDAPQEVYASTRALAERARTLWIEQACSGTRTTESLLEAIPTIPTAGLTGMLVQGAVADPNLAFARMLAIQHRWGCGCEEALEREPDEQAKAVLRDRSHVLLAAAEDSLRSQDLF